MAIRLGALTWCLAAVVNVQIKVARFLAEMIDYVGLLSHGNEEMVIFAWKAFSQWQSRHHDDSPEGREKRHEMYRFMKGFRETFSRPVKRIRFLGLFDTVNSVPRFETAWMQRSKFPYTARSSAKVNWFGPGHGLHS